MTRNMFSQLEKFDVPVGADIVVYDRRGRRALFYHKGADGYRLKLVRHKSGRPIRVRENDRLATMDYDGEILAGDMLGVFERV